jgi:energy-coupling factor transporter ATP-binding protein EcfA2
VDILLEEVSVAIEGTGKRTELVLLAAAVGEISKEELLLIVSRIGCGASELLLGTTSILPPVRNFSKNATKIR